MMWTLAEEEILRQHAGLTPSAIQRALRKAGHRRTIGAIRHRVESGPEHPWGRHDLMVIASVRYCLGRMTYITGDCCDWLIAHWPEIRESTRNVVRRDIEEAFARDDEARAAGNEHKPLGGDCDRAQWERVRQLWSNDGHALLDEYRAACRAAAPLQAVLAWGTEMREALHDELRPSPRRPAHQRGTKAAVR